MTTNASLQEVVDQAHASEREQFEQIWAETSGESPKDVGWAIWIAARALATAAAPAGGRCTFQVGTVQCTGTGLLWDADNDGWNEDHNEGACPACNTAAYLDDAKERAESTSSFQGYSGSGSGLSLWLEAIATCLLWNREAAVLALDHIGTVNCLAEAEEGEELITVPVTFSVKAQSVLLDGLPRLDASDASPAGAAPPELQAPPVPREPHYVVCDEAVTLAGRVAEEMRKRGAPSCHVDRAVAATIRQYGPAPRSRVHFASLLEQTGLLPDADLAERVVAYIYGETGGESDPTLLEHRAGQDAVEAVQLADAVWSAMDRVASIGHHMKVASLAILKHYGPSPTGRSDRPLTSADQLIESGLLDDRELARVILHTLGVASAHLDGQQARPTSAAG